MVEISTHFSAIGEFHTKLISHVLITQCTMTSCAVQSTQYFAVLCTGDAKDSWKLLTDVQRLINERIACSLQDGLNSGDARASNK